jgi:energy-coupling factor transporter transmembrane protein EcfT
MMTHVIRQTTLLAMALEAKGFDPRATRAPAGESRCTAADYVVLAGLAVLLLLCLWLRWNGYGVVEGVGF